jgi:L-ascorbate metabolism protein UlaG (beta-lactamase superfamily)
MYRQTGAHYLVPIHWGTFRLSKEPMDEPMRRLLEAAGERSNEIVIRQIGASWTMPTAGAFTAGDGEQSHRSTGRK